MSQFCRKCQTVKSVEEFNEPHRCLPCVEKFGVEPKITISLPEGWVSKDAGLPDMDWPSNLELSLGYEGTLWTACKGEQRIEIRWMGDHAKFFCRVLLKEQDENPIEFKLFDYPHEVVEWLFLWFQNIGPFTANI